MNTKSARLIFGILLIALGVSALTGVNLFKFIFAFLLIFLGVKIMTGKSWRHYSGRSGPVAQNRLNEVLIFSGSEKRMTSEDFAGGKSVVIFAGETIDLTAVKTKSKTVEMELVAIFGGIKLIVPKGWTVITEGAGVLGGFANEAAAGEGKITLVVDGAAIFGGVEITN